MDGEKARILMALSGLMNTAMQGVTSEQMHCPNGSSQFELDFLPFATKKILTNDTLRRKSMV